MPKIDELIQQLCPDGVEYRPLGDITKKQNAKNKGAVCNLAYSITQAGLVPTSDYFKEAKVTSSDTSGYRIVKRGWFVYSPSRIDVGSINYLHDADEVIVSPINVVFSVDQDRIINTYLLSFLKSSRGMWLIEGKRQGIEGTGRKNLPYERFAEIEIPVPPLEVQQEIVRILDAFTELEANLQRELNARKKQYECCCDTVIKQLDSGAIESRELGSLCQIETGKLNANKAVDNGAYKFFTCGVEDKYIDSYRWDTEALLVAGNGELGYTKHYVGKFEAYQRTYVLSSFSSEVNVRYLYHLMNTGFPAWAWAHKKAASVPYIVVGTVKDYLIPLPPLETQKLIAANLDTMAALQENLQRQIDLTHRQYEHYRDQLLDLPEKVA